MFSWARSVLPSNLTPNVSDGSNKFEVVEVSLSGNMTSSIMTDSAQSSLDASLCEGIEGELRGGATEEEGWLGTSSSSVSNSYSAEWERLFTRPGYLLPLREAAMKGRLRSSRFRSVCWKLFLEVLSESQAGWTSKTTEWRNRYEDLKNQLIVNPRGAEAKDLSINNPLSQEVESPWNQFFLDNELRLTIKQDVIRTYPKIDFYHRDSIRTMMVDILFVYAKLRPDISYRQGMHELLAPLIFILYSDHQAFLHACDIESIGDLTKEILNPQYLEHDAYSMFYQIMEAMESCYVSKEIPSILKGGSALQSQPFLRPQDLHPSNVIVTKLTRIQDYLLKRFDFELYEHLQRMDIAPQIYGIRWVRLLFGREFPMQDLLLLWDAIFADSASFDLVDYIFLAMLLYLRNAMLTSDYPSCLHLLMKYPPVSDVQYFIDKALYLRDPNERPCVLDYQYQKPANFGLNGWEYVPSYVLSSQMTQSASGTSRRPGSLVLEGGGKMYKSTSEPMNLITDSLPSPVVPESASRRKGSTVSLSQIESSLNRGSYPHRPAYTPTQSGSGGGGQAEQMSVASSDGGGNGSSPSKSGSKFFVFGARGGRKSSANAKQKASQKNWEQEAAKAMSGMAEIEGMCRRCATELDIHVGTLQKQMLKKDLLGVDDEVFLALAGVKQVRDVLKGVLKPSFVFDSPDYVLTHNPDPTRRRHSNSAQSSLSATPIYEGAGGDQKYYLATPDLLSSDTDLNSPDVSFPGLASLDRNPSIDTIMPADQSKGTLMSKAEVQSQCDGGKSDAKAAEAGPLKRLSAEVEMGVLKNAAVSTLEGGAGSFDDNQNKSASVRECRQDAVQQSGGAVRRAVQETSRGAAAAAAAAAPVVQNHERESSPMNRLSGLLKNLTKF